MPNWFIKSTVYQIYPDLFSNDNQSLELPAGYHGGTLKGITNKLDYISSFGFDAIYINPIFYSDKPHRYTVIDYFKVDPILGTLEDFEELVRQCYVRNIKLILDIPLNHVSSKHPYFIEVLNNPNSKYSDYFIKVNGDFSRWQNADEAVELNFDNHNVMEEFVLSNHSPIDYWIYKGISGIRLDCANDLGIRVVKEIYKKIKSIDRDIVLIGEVFNYPAPDWTFVLDSLQSYYKTALIFSLVKNKITNAQFSTAINYLFFESRHITIFMSLNILSSHDTKRILDIIGNDIDGYKLLLTFQFTFPGVPVVLYGEEVGLSSKNAELSRKAMIWDEKKWNREIMEMYKFFINLRKNRKELMKGNFKNLTELCVEGVVGYLRHTKKREEFSITLLNYSYENKKFRLFVPYAHLHDKIKLVDVFSGTEFISEMGYIDIEIKPRSPMFLIPDWTYINRYSFYKRY